MTVANDAVDGGFDVEVVGVVQEHDAADGRQQVLVGGEIDAGGRNGFENPPPTNNLETKNKV